MIRPEPHPSLSPHPPSDGPTWRSASTPWRRTFPTWMKRRRPTSACFAVPWGTSRWVPLSLRSSASSQVNFDPKGNCQSAVPVWAGEEVWLDPVELDVWRLLMWPAEPSSEKSRLVEYWDGFLWCYSGEWLQLYAKTRSVFCGIQPLQQINHQKWGFLQMFLYFFI